MSDDVLCLSRFKCDRAVGEIKYERSNLKGIDKKALSHLSNVERFSFSNNSIEKLSPGVCFCVCINVCVLITLIKGISSITIYQNIGRHL